MGKVLCRLQLGCLRRSRHQTGRISGDGTSKDDARRNVRGARPAIGNLADEEAEGRSLGVYKTSRLQADSVNRLRLNCEGSRAGCNSRSACEAVCRRFEERQRSYCTLQPKPRDRKIVTRPGECPDRLVVTRRSLKDR